MLDKAFLASSHKRTKLTSNHHKVILDIALSQQPSVEERRIIILAFKKKQKNKDKNLYIFLMFYLTTSLHMLF